MRTSPVLHEAENEAEATKCGLEDLTSLLNVYYYMPCVFVITRRVLTPERATAEFYCDNVCMSVR